MIPKNFTPQIGLSFALGLLPLSLWLMLFLSLQAGNIENLGAPGFNTTFFHGLRSTLPLIAVFAAVVVLVINVRRQPVRKDLFLGPLGLTAIYGIVGLIASTVSVDGSVSVYWSVSYLSVPLVLWAIVWRHNAFELVRRVLAFNWAVLIFATASVFAFGLIYLNLGNFILSPSDWLDCSSQLWYDKSSHYIRDTGVGRYAALTGIISLSQLWNPRRRSLWILLFVASMVLLLFSGARTALIGFGMAAPIIIILSGRKKAALGILIAVVLLTPVIWATGIHNTVLDNCLFRGLNTSEPVATDKSTAQDVQLEAIEDTAIVGSIKIPSKFFSFTGRREVWETSLDLVGDSPFIGHGFHADRLLLNTHAHNSVVHSLLQTGILGTVPFVAGLLMAWVLLVRAGRNLAGFSQEHRPLFIQIAGILAFLSVRSLTESTGAFFGVDWLLLGPMLLYLQIINSRSVLGEITDQQEARIAS